MHKSRVRNELMLGKLGTAMRGTLMHSILIILIMEMRQGVSSLQPMQLADLGSLFLHSETVRQLRSDFYG